MSKSTAARIIRRALSEKSLTLLGRRMSTSSVPTTTKSPNLVSKTLTEHQNPSTFVRPLSSHLKSDIKDVTISDIPQSVQDFFGQINISYIPQSIQDAVSKLEEFTKYLSSEKSENEETIKNSELVLQELVQINNSIENNKKDNEATIETAEKVDSLGQEIINSVLQNGEDTQGKLDSLKQYITTTFQKQNNDAGNIEITVGTVVNNIELIQKEAAERHAELMTELENISNLQKTFKKENAEQNKESGQEENNEDDYKKWFKDILKYGIGFTGAMTLVDFVNEKITDKHKGKIIKEAKEFAKTVRDLRQSNEKERWKRDVLEQINDGNKELLAFLLDDSLLDDDHASAQNPAPENAATLLAIELASTESLLGPSLKIFLGAALSSYYIGNGEHSKAQEVIEKNIKLIERKLGNRINIQGGLSCEVPTLYNELRKEDPALPTVTSQLLYYAGKIGMNKVDDQSKYYSQLAVDLRQAIEKDPKSDEYDYYNNPNANDTVIFQVRGTILHDMRHEAIKEDIALEKLEEDIQALESLKSEANLMNEKECRAKITELHILTIRKLQSDTKQKGLDGKLTKHLGELDKASKEYFKNHEALKDGQEDYDKIFTSLSKKTHTRELNNVGNILLVQGDHDRARLFYGRTIEIEIEKKTNIEANEKIYNNFSLPDAYLAMAEIEGIDNNQEKSQEYLGKYKAVQDNNNELIAEKRVERIEKRQLTPSSSPKTVEPSSIAAFADCLGFNR